MINKGDKAVCVLCSGTGVCRTLSVKRHFETYHKSFCEKSEPEQKELIASAIKDRNKQSTSMFKYVSKNCHTSAASYSAANAIARHGKTFQEGEFLKEVWLACASSLFKDFDNKDKIIQRIKNVPLSRNTMKDRILKLAENVTDQQKNDFNSAPFISLCFDESTNITKSARLALFALYCVENIIKEELIAIISLLTTTKVTDICTAVRNSLAEKEIDLKKIVSVTTDGAPNMVGFEPTTFGLEIHRAILYGSETRRVAVVAEWYRYRTVACLVTSSTPVPLKTRHVGQRCTLNLSRAETSSCWCGVVVRRGGACSGVVHVT
ncbi:general transcription factor II-I repeat domain-containing protein 2A [Trichonephila clavipes]|nr:general transcription factor II-I repeat domain-containing protein 2A [Trichonephila clavipes]